MGKAPPLAPTESPDIFGSTQVKVNFENHPRYQLEDEDTLEMQLWEGIAKKGLLISPGSYFMADANLSPADSFMAGHFRMSFSNGEVSCHCHWPVCWRDAINVMQRDSMKKAVDILAVAIREFFEL